MSGRVHAANACAKQAHAFRWRGTHRHRQSLLPATVTARARQQRFAPVLPLLPVPARDAPVAWHPPPAPSSALPLPPSLPPPPSPSRPRACSALTRRRLRLGPPARALAGRYASLTTPPTKSLSLSLSLARAPTLSCARSISTSPSRSACSHQPPTRRAGLSPAADRSARRSATMAAARPELSLRAPAPPGPRRASVLWRSEALCSADCPSSPVYNTGSVLC